MSGNFERFPDLPKELQLMIWKAVTAAYDPVYVVIEADNTPSNHELRLRSSACVPPVLQVCQDSRRIALGTYQLAFRAVDGRPQYFDFNRDILHINSQVFVAWMWDAWIASHQTVLEDLHQIQYLALYTDRENTRSFVNLRQLERFPSLRHLQYGEFDSQTQFSLQQRQGLWQRMLRKRWSNVMPDRLAPTLTFLTIAEVDQLLYRVWTTLTY